MTRAAALLAVSVTAAAAQPLDHMVVEKVVVGSRFAEGPVWSPEGFLLFSDVPSNHIMKLAPGQRAAVWREGAAGPSGNAFDAQGRLYTCQTRARRVVRWDRKGAAEVLAERWEGKRLNAPNDIVVRKDGQVYFTDPAFGYQQDERELDFCGVFHLTPKRELKLVAKFSTRPNGIALSPNGRILYVTDSDTHTVHAWDLERNGDAGAGRVLVSGIEGVPGGLRTDEKGNLYVAAQGLAVYSPAGKLLGTVPIGEPASNCAFGEPGTKVIFVTARTAVYRLRPETDAEASR